MTELLASPTLEAPFAPWIFEYVLSALGLVLIAFFIRASVRARELTFALLVTVSGATMWWQEWYADWGVYLLYSPKFHLMPWGATQWASPNKPWFMPFAYAWYYGLIYVGITVAIFALRRTKPRLGKLSSVLIIAVPFFYLWDLLVEGVSVGLGYWTYFDTFGPTIVFASTAISLVHPLIIFTIYGVVAAYLLSDRDDNGHARFESVFRVASVRPGWRRESVRMVAYVVVMNLTFFIFMSVPMIAVRELFGHANAFVP
jgi:Spirocyclase AveC-like